jgi:hypothetical protein
MEKEPLVGVVTAVTSFTIVAGTMVYLQGDWDKVEPSAFIILGISWLMCVFFIVKYLKPNRHKQK